MILGLTISCNDILSQILNDYIRHCLSIPSIDILPSERSTNLTMLITSLDLLDSFPSSC